ncbi:hypothetical protein GNI_127510 [Gregarina niphandrodes]|uniref:Uncharacterized protein n=1 Tax=Gregarina niphandrodes TaxID=110365 RepID=A0A023B1T3_GRENI|nr:hypothetical protein GNI_127510 [Gregarina niphandrodes]EZG49270.1 hypothetical protein GNI_127510 [Gregarina niphandrodes]|eukprot:XP_011132054.1 hypothetical protein GNI_127510 [Gregarina niphandrodes]
MKRVYKYRNLVVQIDNLFTTESAEIYIKDTANRKKYACCNIGQNIMLNLIQTRPSINFKVLGDGERFIAETDVITDELLLCQENYLERRHDLYLPTGEKWATLELVYLFDKTDGMLNTIKPSISSLHPSVLNQVIYITFIDLLANLKKYEVEVLLGPHKVYLPKQIKTCLTYDTLGHALMIVQVVHPLITYMAQLPLSPQITDFRGTIRCFAEANEYVDVELDISIPDHLGK